MNNLKRVFCLGLGMLLLVVAGARGEQVSTAFDAANKLYFEGKFPEAATTYGMLAQSGQRSAALYYNWGNALFKSGRFGRAIAAYREAGAMAPRNPDVRANLQFARNQIQGPTMAASKTARWLERLTLNEWAILAAISVWAWFLLLAVRQWQPGLRRQFRGVVLGLGVAMVLLCGCAVAACYDARGGEIAIVITADAAVKHGPLEESQNAFIAHDGAELRVLDRKDDWLQVEADPQRIGWVKGQAVVIWPAREGSSLQTPTSIQLSATNIQTAK